MKKFFTSLRNLMRKRGIEKNNDSAGFSTSFDSSKRKDASFHSYSMRDHAMPCSKGESGFPKNLDLKNLSPYFYDEDSDRNFFQKFFARIRNLFSRD